MELAEEQLFQQRTDLSALNRSLHEIRSQISKVIVGQYKMIDLLLIGLLSDGHILIEGVPGVAKTLTAKLVAKVIDADFSRIQFRRSSFPLSLSNSIAARKAMKSPSLLMSMP